MGSAPPTGHADGRTPPRSQPQNFCGGARGTEDAHPHARARTERSTLGPASQTPVSDARDSQLLRSRTRAPRSPSLRYGSADAPSLRWRWHAIDPGSRQSGLRSHGTWRSQHRRRMDWTGRETAGMPLPAAQDGIKAFATGAEEPFEVAGMRKLGQGALRQHPASSALTDPCAH